MAWGWFALALGVTLLASLFDHFRLARKVGRLEAKDETNQGKIKWLLKANELLRSPIETPDERRESAAAELAARLSDDAGTST